MKIKVFGTDDLYLDGDLLIDSEGERIEPANKEGLLPVTFFGKPILVTVDWLRFVTFYRIFIPLEVRKDPSRLVVTRNVTSTKMGTGNSYICWFREPIEYKDGFRIIARFPNYAIDRSGNVMAVGSDRYVKRRLYSYLECYLNDNLVSRSYTALIHRLVLFTFNPPLSDREYRKRPFVNHIDGDKTNCRIENLEWVTAMENHRHALETGLIETDPAIVLDIRTNKEMRFPSLQKAADFIGRARLTIADINKRINQKPFNKYFKIQLERDKKPWVEYNREMFVVTETDKRTGESYTYPDIRSFRISHRLWNERGRGGVEEMVKLVNKEKPHLLVTYKEQYQKVSKVQVREVATGEVFEFESIRDASRKLGMSFCLVHSAVNKGDAFHNGGYQFRFKTDREWNPKPRLIGKIRNIYRVFDTKTKEERVYDSERKFAAAEGIPYPSLRFWKKEDRKTFGDIEWTMEQVTYEMKYKFDKLRNKASR